MTLRVAVVGTGSVAVRSYLPHLARRQDVELTYYNRTCAKAEAAAQQFGGRVAGTLADLVSQDPDAVLVLTREMDRYAAACALLDHAPRRLFFEKPLVAQQGQERVTEEDFFLAKEILSRAASIGTEIAMVFNYRFFDQTVLAKEIAAGFGRPTHFTALVHYACWSHAIDLLLDFVGPMAEITALSSRDERTWGANSAADVTVAARSQGDATGTIIGTCGIDFKLPLYELTLAFEGGRIHMRDLDGDLEVVDYATRRHQVHRLSRDVSRWDQYTASFGKSVDAYLDSILAGDPPPVPGIAGLRELQFEAAIRRSIAQTRPVCPDAEFPID
jgi:predicted dehydrogenase